MYAQVTLILALFVVSAGSGLPLVTQSTTGAGPRDQVLGGNVISTDLALQVTWDSEAEQLPGIPGWQPVSFRVFESDGDVYAYAELRNVTDEYAKSPTLNVEVFQDDFSYGTFTFMWGAEVPWAKPHGSAFYQTTRFFDSSLGVADWNGMVLSLTDEYIDHFDGLTSEGLVVEGRRLLNETELDIPPVYVGTFVRDSQGIYSGSCEGPRTGARTPAGGSVRLSDEADPDYIPGCIYSNTGKRGSEELGVGGPYSSEYLIIGFDQN